MKVRAFIVDDEAPARRELRFLLEQLPHCLVVGEASNGEEALRLLADLDADVAFLDIHMHDMDGLLLARTLADRGFKGQVVFATAYDQYAVKAFELHALDYVLKPFDPERLAATWERVLQSRSEGKLLEKRLDAISQILMEKGSLDPRPEKGPTAPEAPPPGRCLRRLAAQRGEKLLLVDTDKIRYATVEGRKASIRVDGELLETTLTLQELEERLDREQFFRTHRAYLVNLKAVREIAPWFNGAYVLRLDDGSEVPVSRNYVKPLKEVLGL